MQNVKSKEEFFKLQEKLEFVPFAQSKGWHNYMSSKNNDIPHNAIALHPFGHRAREHDSIQYSHR